MRSAKDRLHDSIEHLSEQEARETLRLFEDIASSEDTLRLAQEHVSNAKKIVLQVSSEENAFADLKKGTFEPFHAIPVGGILASQVLIADRR